MPRAPFLQSTGKQSSGSSLLSNQSTGSSISATCANGFDYLDCLEAGHYHEEPRPAEPQNYMHMVGSGLKRGFVNFASITARAAGGLIGIKAPEPEDEGFTMGETRLKNSRPANQEYAPVAQGNRLVSVPKTNF